jgi:hypothetical protein
MALISVSGRPPIPPIKTRPPRLETPQSATGRHRMPYPRERVLGEYQIYELNRN